MDYTWILCIALLLLQMIKTKGKDVYCSVNNNITVEFTVNPPGSLIFWRRDGNDLRDVEVNAAGDGCASYSLPDPVGYEFDCKTVNNMAVYILQFKSKTEDSGLDFSLSVNPTPTFSYTAYMINGVKPNHTDCGEKGKFEDELMCKVDCNCVNPSLSWKYTTEDQREGSINIPGIEPVPCGPGGDHFYKLDINVKNSEIMELLPDNVTGLVTVTGTLTIGDEIVPLSTTLTVNDSVTTVEPSTQTSSSRMSSEPPTTSLSSPSSSLSSTSSGQDGGDSPSTVTTPTSVPPTHTPTDTSPTPSPLTTTELIVIVVCSCIGFLLLVVLVVCCVILSIRRKNRKRHPPRNKPYGDNSMTRYPYHHSLKTETKTTSSSNPGSRQPSSSERVRPELQYTNYGYYNARPYRNYDNNHRPSRRDDNVYNNHRPSRRDDNRRQREDINLTPYRLYYQPHQYHYL